MIADRRQRPEQLCRTLSPSGHAELPIDCKTANGHCAPSYIFCHPVHPRPSGFDITRSTNDHLVSAPSLPGKGGDVNAVQGDGKVTHVLRTKPDWADRRRVARPRTARRDDDQRDVAVRRGLE